MIKPGVYIRVCIITLINSRRFPNSLYINMYICLYLSVHINVCCVRVVCPGADDGARKSVHKHEHTVLT
jgi:hypothetical protein